MIEAGTMIVVLLWFVWILWIVGRNLLGLRGQGQEKQGQKLNEEKKDQ